MSKKQVVMDEMVRNRQNQQQKGPNFTKKSLKINFFNKKSSNPRFNMQIIY